MCSNIVILSLLAFSTSVTTSLQFGAVVNGNRMGGVPLGISLSVGELDVEGICTESGVACQNCTHSVTCVLLPGGWLKVPLEECIEGTTCNAHLGKCSDQPVPECDADGQQYRHTCEQVGIFPDAIDCRKFHLCSPPENLPDGRPADHRIALCPRHYGYNPQTAQCSIKLEHGQCEHRPAPQCSKVGQYGALPTSPNHYYVCLVKNRNLYPQIFVCPHGWYFYDGFCHEEKLADTTSEESSEESTSKFEDTTTSKPTTSRIESFFSTEKAVTYPADTFLADKFDLTNYESTDDVVTTNDDFATSFENDWQ